MKCEHCGEHDASVHYTVIHNGVRTEKHLCAHCAQQEKMPGASALGGLFGGGFNMSELLGDFMESSPAPQQEVLRCKRCGLDYATFRRTGRLGCAQCYRDFLPALEPLLSRIHGRTRHEGMRPGSEYTGAPQPEPQESRIDALSRELNEAIAKEHFERAAELRDEIRALRQKEE